MLVLSTCFIGIHLISLYSGLLLSLYPALYTSTWFTNNHDSAPDQWSMLLSYFLFSLSLLTPTVRCIHPKYTPDNTPGLSLYDVHHLLCPCLNVTVSPAQGSVILIDDCCNTHSLTLFKKPMSSRRQHVPHRCNSSCTYLHNPLYSLV